MFSLCWLSNPVLFITIIQIQLTPDFMRFYQKYEGDGQYTNLVAHQN